MLKFQNIYFKNDNFELKLINSNIVDGGQVWQAGNYGVGTKYFHVFTHWNIFEIDCSPVREGVKTEERDSVGVDADADDDDADKVHEEASLHHVAGLHRTVSKHNSIGSCGYWKSKCIGASNTLK